MAHVQLEDETRDLSFPTELLSNDFSHLNVGCKFISETQMQSYSAKRAFEMGLFKEHEFWRDGLTAHI